MALLKTYHASVSAADLCPPLPSSSMSDESESGVRRLVTVLHREYVGLRSPTQTLRSNLLQLMGRLAEYYPEETRPKVREG